MPRTRYAVPHAGQGSLHDAAEIEVLTELLGSGRHLSSGIERGRLEADFARELGARHAVAVTSCTAALHLATHLLGLRAGDNVVATPQTYQATVAALLSQPAVEVRWCDVDATSLNLDPHALPPLVDSRTRAVFVTHYGGTPAAMEPIVAVARAHDAQVIEDCAHALGSDSGGRPVGVLGDMGCFSFHSLKNMSTLGQGGMLVLRDAELAARARALRDTNPDALFVHRPIWRNSELLRPPDRDLNRHAKNAYSHDCTHVRLGGLNYTMSEPAAAVGRVQLRKLPRMVDRRRHIAGCLDEGLGQLPGIRVTALPEADHSGYHLYTFFVDPRRLDRDALAARLDDAGIEMHLRYFPLHLLPEWRQRGSGPGDCPVAEQTFFHEMINLPIYPAMTDDQVELMIATIRSATRIGAVA